MPAVIRKAWSIDETAETLGVTSRHIRNLIERGELRSVKAGRRRLIPDAVLEDFLNGGDAA